MGHAGRDVEHRPMPEAAAGRRIRIIDGDGEALGAGRGAGPGKFRRMVGAGAAEAVEHLIHGDGAAVLERGAGDGETARSGGGGLEHQDGTQQDGAYDSTHAVTPHRTATAGAVGQTGEYTPLFPHMRNSKEKPPVLRPAASKRSFQFQRASYLSRTPTGRR